MKITKHGKSTKKQVKYESFKCDKCGCEFEVKEDEYYIDSSYIGGIGLSISNLYEKTYVCSCPECHKIVKKTENSTSIVYTSKLDDSETTHTSTYKDYCTCQGTQHSTKDSITIAMNAETMA